MALCSMVVLSLGPTSWARDKSDVVTLVNGDRVTGEVKSLDLGVLTVSTDSLGTLSIEWVAVAALESEQLFEVEEQGGESFVGILRPGQGSGDLEVVDVEGGVHLLRTSDVVRIASLEKRWLERWGGHIDLGVTLASANRQEDLTVDAEATYLTESFRLQTTLTGSSSDRDEADKTSRVDLTSSFRRSLARRWFWFVGLQLSRNEELDLELRTTVSGGGGRYAFLSNRAQWSLYGGLSALRESYTGQESGEWSSEAVLASDYQLYLFEGKETSLAANLSLLPSLTVSGRYRGEFSSSFRRKMVRDFTIALTLAWSYDSKPPENSDSSDARVQTTLGWSF